MDTVTRTESPIYSRRLATQSSNAGSLSPARSHHHARSASTTAISNVKRTQNYAAKAAAQRLAQVMASRTTDDDEDDDDEEVDGGGDFAFRSGFASPALPRRGVSNGRNAKPAIPTARISSNSSPVLSGIGAGEVTSARSKSNGRPAVSNSSTSTTVPPRVNHLRSQSSLPPLDSSTMRSKERFLAEVGQNTTKSVRNQQEDSTLCDELDMLHEEKDKIREQLKIEQEKCKEAEARVKELEKQVASLGEGVSLDAKLLSRKEAALRQREAALRDAKESNSHVDAEVAALRSEIKKAKDEVATASGRLQGTQSEIESLNSMMQRMVLTQKEMEEVVLKRCWLARYWGLAAEYGIYADIAVTKSEYWSSLAPLPFEIVVSAGQKAKEESLEKDDASESRIKLVQDFNDLSGEAIIESMLSVEMGLMELASLKVEDMVTFVLMQHRRLHSARASISDLKSPREFKYMEAFELSVEESEDILFKEAWLTYFWRRALALSIEEDIARKRLQFWIDRSLHAPTSHDAVYVEQGLMELRKLGIERRLWEASRKEVDFE